MDVSTDIGTAGESTADLAVRATVGAAARYLAARDRVGLICFAGSSAGSARPPAAVRPTGS